MNFESRGKNFGVAELSGVVQREGQCLFLAIDEGEFKIISSNCPWGSLISYQRSLDVPIFS